MPRFVLLTHDFPRLHLDLMLEGSAAARTWRLSAPPSAVSQLAEAIGDHRLAYLDYEGPVSGDRGRVARWDAGTFEWIEDHPDLKVVRLVGLRLQGLLQLHFQKDAHWQLRFDGMAEG